MPDIGEIIIEHQLNVNLEAWMVKQRKISINTKKYAAIVEEVDLLLAVGFIREVHYPKWLSNVVLIKNSSKKWRM